MNLTDYQIQIIQRAAKEYGKAELARKLGITRQAIYDVLRRGAGFNEQTMEKIEGLVKACESPAAAPAATVESPGIESLVIEELRKLSQDDQKKVYRYCIELQIKEG